MPDKLLTLTADVGGSHITLALISSGKIIETITIQANPVLGMRTHLSLMETAARTLIDKRSLGFQDLSGFGIAVPMLVDPELNRVISTVTGKYEDAKSIDFVEWSKKTFGLNVRLEVDGNAGCIGEWFYGAGKGIDDLVYVTLGTGYGSSVILRGRALRGRQLTAGVLSGHMVINQGGNKCLCPGKGCVEAETGTWALPGIACRTEGYEDSLVAKREHIDYGTLFEDMSKGDKVATKLVHRSINYWAASLVNLSLAYNPQKIILAGGVLRAADYIITRLNDYIKKQLWTTGEYPEVCLAENQETAALLGAYAIVNETIEYT